MIFLQSKSILFEDKMIMYIYLPIIIWIVVVIVYLFFLTKRFTFGKWTQENPNPYATETMGLPRGVMRGILTLTLLFGVLLLEIFAIENPAFEGHIEQFIMAFQMMLAFYFGSKVMHHLASVDRSKTAYVTDSITKVEETKASASVANVATAAAASSSSVPAAAPSEEASEADFEDAEAEG